jgi:hypothetical protein
MTRMIKDLLILFQIVVGFAWIAMLILGVIMMSATSGPVSILAVVGCWGSTFVAAILLISGSAYLTDKEPQWRRASLWALVGSIALFVQSLVLVVPVIGDALREHATGLVVSDACVVGVSLVSSAVAYGLHRTVPSSSRKATIP